MSDPTVTCDWCGRTRSALLHQRAEHPPTAAKKWLKKTCTEPKVHDGSICSGCSGHQIKPCEFVYRAGVQGFQR